MSFVILIKKMWWNVLSHTFNYLASTSKQMHINQTLLKFRNRFATCAFWNVLFFYSIYICKYISIFITGFAYVELSFSSKSDIPNSYTFFQNSFSKAAKIVSFDEKQTWASFKPTHVYQFNCQKISNGLFIWQIKFSAELYRLDFI